MVQVIYNGVAVGHLTEANAKVYLRETSATIVSQSAATICVKG